MRGAEEIKARKGQGEEGKSELGQRKARKLAKARALKERSALAMIVLE